MQQSKPDNEEVKRREVDFFVTLDSVLSREKTNSRALLAKDCDWIIVRSDHVGRHAGCAVEAEKGIAPKKREEEALDFLHKKKFSAARVEKALPLRTG